MEVSHMGSKMNGNDGRQLRVVLLGALHYRGWSGGITWIDIDILFDL